MVSRAYIRIKSIPSGVSFSEHFETYSNFKHELNRDGGSFKQFVRRHCKSLRQLYQNDFAVVESSSFRGVSQSSGIIVKKPTQVREQYSEIKDILNLQKHHYVVKHPLDGHDAGENHKGRCVLCCYTCRHYYEHQEKEWKSHSRMGTATTFGCRDCYLLLEQHNYKQTNGGLLDGFDPELYRGVLYLCIKAGHCKEYPDKSCWDIWHDHISPAPSLCCKKHRLGEGSGQSDEEMTR